MLRRFRPADAQAFTAYRSSPQVARYQGWEAPYPRQAAEQFIHQMTACHPDTAGKGYGHATDAARALLGYLFTLRGKHRVTARCGARNTASARVLERLGVRREGPLREGTWANGEWTDDLLYALLSPECFSSGH